LYYRNFLAFHATAAFEREKILNYREFFDVLKNATVSTPKTEDRLQLQINTPKFLSDFSKLNINYQSKMINKLQEFAANSTSFGESYVNSLLYLITGDMNYAAKSVKKLDRINLPSYEYINDYFTLSELRFVFPELAQKNILPPQLLRERYKKGVEGILSRYPLQDGFKTNPSRVVVLIDQLLAKSHAPTSRALKFVQILQEDFNKEVLLVNTCMHSALSSGAIARRKFASVLTDLSRVDKQLVDGVMINLFQPNPAILNDQSIRAVIDKIADFGPSGILVVGNQCAIAEVFAERCFTLCSPLNNDVVPESINVNFHTHTLDTIDAENAGVTDGPDVQDLLLFQFEGPYDIPAKSQLVSRQDLNLPEDRPVLIVVGNRLDLDIDDGFLDMLEGLVSQNGAFVFFLGQYQNFSQLKETRPDLAECSEHCAFHSDLVSVYENCDVYLAPKRIGGGSSAVYAMATGLPVLSIGYGDVKITAQHFPEITSHEEMGRVASQLLNDPAKMEEYKSFSRTGSGAIKDSKDLMAEFVKYMDQLNEENSLSA
jgi:hypothetical protein